MSFAQNLGKIWKTLSEEQQAPFRKEAEKLRYLHQLEYPDYKYRPKKRQRSGPESAAAQVPCSTIVKTEPSDPELSPDSGVAELLDSGSCGSPEKRVKFSEPGSPAYTFPAHSAPLSCINPDYFSPGLTPPPKVPSSPDMVSVHFIFHHFILLWLFTNGKFWFSVQVLTQGLSYFRSVSSYSNNL